jgi:hypothetical protein
MADLKNVYIAFMLEGKQMYFSGTSYTADASKATLWDVKEREWEKTDYFQTRADSKKTYTINLAGKDDQTLKRKSSIAGTTRGHDYAFVIDGSPLCDSWYCKLVEDPQGFLRLGGYLVIAEKDSSKLEWRKWVGDPDSIAKKNQTEYLKERTEARGIRNVTFIPYIDIEVEKTYASSNSKIISFINDKGVSQTGVDSFENKDECIDRCHEDPECNFVTMHVSKKTCHYGKVLSSKPVNALGVRTFNVVDKEAEAEAKTKAEEEAKTKAEEEAKTKAEAKAKAEAEPLVPLPFVLGGAVIAIFGISMIR